MLESTKDSNLISCSKKYNCDIKMLTNVNIFEFLSFLSFVQHYHHTETQSNHFVTGAYITNQSTNRGVRQQ